jgi:hypothetical protein
MSRTAEKYGVVVSYDAKPVPGDWNGSGCVFFFEDFFLRCGLFNLLVNLIPVTEGGFNMVVS